MISGDCMWFVIVMVLTFGMLVFSLNLPQGDVLHRTDVSGSGVFATVAACIPKWFLLFCVFGAGGHAGFNGIGGRKWVDATVLSMCLFKKALCEKSVLNLNARWPGELKFLKIALRFQTNVEAIPGAEKITVMDPDPKVLEYKYVAMKPLGPESPLLSTYNAMCLWEVMLLLFFSRSANVISPVF